MPINRVKFEMQDEMMTDELKFETFNSNIQILCFYSVGWVGCVEKKNRLDEKFWIRFV